MPGSSTSCRVIAIPGGCLYKCSPLAHLGLNRLASSTRPARKAMQFGYFDDAAKEYVITRPDTPRPWANYLGTTEYGAIITNNAGGYSFYRSASNGRFLRLRSNAVPLDQPGRYFYLRDRDNGDFWSASWQPVGKSLDNYESVCRHGTAYTIITSQYDGIETESTYFVQLKQTFEYSHCTSPTARQSRGNFPSSHIVSLPVLPTFITIWSTCNIPSS